MKKIDIFFYTSEEEAKRRLGRLQGALVMPDGGKSGGAGALLYIKDDSGRTFVFKGLEV